MVRTVSVVLQDSSGQEMAERLCPSAFYRVERAMIEGAEHRQCTLTGFPGTSHVLSKLPFRTTPRCPVVLPKLSGPLFIWIPSISVASRRTLNVPLIPGTRTGSYSFHSEKFCKSYRIFRNRYYIYARPFIYIVSAQRRSDSL